KSGIHDRALVLEHDRAYRYTSLCSVYFYSLFFSFSYNFIMAPKRPRTRGGYTSSSSTRPIHLQFDTEEAEERYGILSTLPIEPNRGIAYPSLAQVDMDAEVCRLLSATGWERFTGISEPTYLELLLEFLCTLHFDRTRFSLTRPHMVSFRLCGHQYSFSVSKFGIACGFYTDDEIDTLEYAASITTLPE